MKISNDAFKKRIDQLSKPNDQISCKRGESQQLNLNIPVMRSRKCGRKECNISVSGSNFVKFPLTYTPSMTQSKQFVDFKASQGSQNFEKSLFKKNKILFQNQNYVSSDYNSNTEGHIFGETL